MFKKKKANDEAKRIKEEEAVAKAIEDEDTLDNEDADATANENGDEEAAKAKVDEIATKRAKLLAELDVSLTFSEVDFLHVNWTRLGHCVSRKDANESVDAAAKAKKDEEAATKRSNFIVRLKARSKELSKSEKQIHVEETKDDDVNEEETENKEDAEEKDDVVEVFKNIQTMPFLNTSKRLKTQQADKDREDSKDLNKEIEGENNKDEIREATKSKNEEIIDEKTKRTKKMEEATVRMKCCLKQKKKRCRKTKSSDSKEKKSRNNASEEEDDTKSESEEELKMTRKMKKDGAEEDTKPRKKVTYPTCNTRLSPKALFDAMSCLTNERKRCLKQMGFERYINFPIVELPSTLAYHVIDNFYTPSMELRLQKGSVKATRQKVHDILGIPMGNTKLQDLEQRDANDPFIAELEAQYSHLKKPTPSAIALQISSTTEEDFMFKMNFITMFGSTIGTLENGGRVPTKLLKCIKEEDDIAKIDWCGYILDCLRNYKVNWKDAKNKNNFYDGLLTFLCLLYLDSTFFLDLNIIRHRPSIRSWNTMMIRKRINMETRQKCLGSLEHHGDFNPEEEPIGIDLYKGLDVYIKPLSDRIPVTRVDYYKKIIQKFDKILKERSELVRTLRDGVTNESFMDDYRDGNSDADDNNKKNHDERATMADGNKKSKNENEKKTGVEKKENIDENGTRTKEGGTEAKDDGDDNIKYKDGSEAKDNRYEVSDKNGNESEKKKQYEADKVEKVQEIQKEHTLLTQDQFMNKEYDLTDKQYEELEIQATKDIKKKQTTKKKSIVDMTPPSFSLDKRHVQVEEDNGEYDEEKQFEAFSKTIKSEFKKDHEIKNMKDLEMAFFSIIAHEHYYLVVFNFLKGNTVIIDNSKTMMTYDAKYKNVCELLKKLFSKHLEKVEHPRAKDVLNKKPTILRPKWGTKENETYCKFFLMMYMEHYNGDTAKNWNLEFLTEEEGNTLDIIKMRVRGTWYAREPLWGCSELGGYLVVKVLLRIASLSHATYPEQKCFPRGILVYTGNLGYHW
uniref:Ulp1 protease family, C-terminal catalytic domain-containing protein n=1 Tax=Tanacetum cinerariifolium TaxID=118510 RepID=A0A6L2P4G4_TANCI|nr:hypothetical protein [Tanacetum cinerariifolium]